MTDVEKQLTSRVGVNYLGKKLFQCGATIKILTNLNTMPRKPRDVIAASLTFMRNSKFLIKNEDYFQVSKDAEELRNVGSINRSGSGSFIILYSKIGIYKIADYFKDRPYRVNVNKYFSDIEFEEIISDRFDFDPKEKEWNVLNGELSFSYRCIASIYGNLEVKQISKFAGNKLVPFGKLVEYISNIKKEELKLDHLIKIHDYITSTDIPDKEVYYKNINDAISTDANKISIVPKVSKDQLRVAYTEISDSDYEKPILSSLYHPIPIMIEEEKQTTQACLSAKQLNEFTIPTEEQFKKCLTNRVPYGTNIPYKSMNPNINMMNISQPTPIKETKDDIASSLTFNASIERVQKVFKLSFKDGTIKEFKAHINANLSVKMGTILEVKIVEDNKETILMFKTDDIVEMNMG